MDFSLGLNQSQSLQQRMQLTAQMIHGLDLLQLGIMELNAQIDKELVENPVLEIVGDAKVSRDEASTFESEKKERLEEKENSFNKLDQLDGNFDDEQQLSFGNSNSEYSKMDAMENTAIEKITLVDHLLDQLNFLELNERDHDLVEHLIYRLNASGFFEETIEEIMEKNSIEATREEWEKAIDFIQELEPEGVGAFGLEDSLILQLHRKNIDQPLLEKLIKNYFQDILHNRLPKIAKELEISMDELKENIKHLRLLNPKPGAAYSSQSSDPIKPDIVIEEVEGELVVKVSSIGIPQLGINSYYVDMLEDNLDSKTKKFIKEKVSNASKIIESIDKRRETLYKISTELVKTQKNFFKEGVSGLKPLMMQEVADRVGMHVSTVCRTVANKYVQSSMGTYPLKFFFVNSSGSDDGSTTTQEVLQKIKTMIENEDKKKPLSDQLVVELLKKDQLKLARRTVTKYREQLGIPSSVKRKEH